MKNALKNFIENLNKATLIKSCFAMVSSKRKVRVKKNDNLSMIYPSYKFTIVGPARGIKTQTI